MSTVFTPAQRAITALTLGKPDEIPTFELEFQLGEELFGYSTDDRELYDEKIRASLSDAELEARAIALADKCARIYGNKTAVEMGPEFCCGDEEKDNRPGLDYCIIPVYHAEWRDVNSPITKAFRKRLREHFGNTRLFGGHGDGTFTIPSGEEMYDFIYRIADEPEDVHEEAMRIAKKAMEDNLRQHEAGLDVALLCSDYCFNDGPFLSPAMFDEFITPYLTMVCQSARKDGLYVIKHTDGNIMPIIDSLLAAGPHALHSLDPMAGVDIREVKRLYGDRVALCGNVHCAAMQTGTDEEVIASTEYCLKYGGEGGGYIFATSNVPFKGMPPHRYEMILDIWKKMRKYE